MKMNWQALYSTILPVARAVAGSQHADDIAQEAAIKVWKAAANRQDIPRSFVQRTTYNAAVDYLRKNQRHMANVSLYQETDPLNNGSALVMEHGELDKGIEAFEGSYNPRAKHCTFSQEQLMRLQGLSYKQIADALGLPVGTVRSRLHYSKRKLAGV